MSITDRVTRTAVPAAITAPAETWVAANARWLRVVVGVLGVVVLLWGNDVSLSRPFWSMVLVGVLLAVVQVLVGAADTSAFPKVGRQAGSGLEGEVTR